MRTSTLTCVLSAFSLARAMCSDDYHCQGHVITNCSRPGVIALTYDDGPHIYGPGLLDQLAEAGAKATFFVTGTGWNCIYDHSETLQRAYDEGHQIASHTWSHADLAVLGLDQIATEMHKLDNAIANILGVEPRYMRPPYGSIGGSVLDALWDLGYEVVTWDVDTIDWKADVATSKKYVAHAGSDGNGHIVLMHETHQSTVDLLTPWILHYAKKNDLEFVTVAECVGDSDGAYYSAEGNGSTSCW